MMYFGILAENMPRLESQEDEVEDILSRPLTDDERRELGAPFDEDVDDDDGEEE